MASTSSSISPSNTRNHSVSDQITSIAGNAAVHDAKGNLTEYEINTKQYEVDYDLENRIIKVDVNNSDVDYRYDAFGRQIIRKEGSDETAILWWGNSECAEYEHSAGQATIQNDIFSDPNQLNAVIARAKDGSKFDIEWYHKNYLDHVYAVSDDSGDLNEHYRYTAFGEVTIYNGSGAVQSATQINNSILWNTRRLDAVSNYYLYKYRHYDPALGRWPSRDPIEERGGVNLYGFVGNDPVSRWDRLGLFFAPITDGFADLEEGECISITLQTFIDLQEKAWGGKLIPDEILAMGYGCVGLCQAAQDTDMNKRGKDNDKPEEYPGTQCWAGSEGYDKAVAASKNCPKGSKPLIWSKQGHWKDPKNPSKDGSLTNNDSIVGSEKDKTQFNYVTRLGNYFVEMKRAPWTETYMMTWKAHKAKPLTLNDIDYKMKDAVTICRGKIKNTYPAEMWCMSCCPIYDGRGYNDGY